MKAGLASDFKCWLNGFDISSLMSFPKTRQQNRGEGRISLKNIICYGLMSILSHPFAHVRQTKTRFVCFSFSVIDTSRLWVVIVLSVVEIRQQLQLWVFQGSSVHEGNCSASSASLCKAVLLQPRPLFTCAMHQLSVLSCMKVKKIVECVLVSKLKLSWQNINYVLRQAWFWGNLDHQI